MTDTEQTDTPRPRVLVVDRSRTFSEELRQALEKADGDEAPEIVHLPRTTWTVDVVAEEGPWDVVVAGPSEASKTGLRRLANVRAQDPDVGVLAAVNGSEPADVQILVRARPDELVRLPLGYRDLAAALHATVNAARARRQQHEPPAAPAPVAQLAPPPAPTRTGRVVVVGGPTGGCGKTTLAINLAAMLGAWTDRRVVLVDLDLQFGEVTAALQLRATHSVYDLLFDEADRPLGRAEVAESLADSFTDTQSGFQVLAAPRDPVQADAITAEQVEMLLDIIRGHADEVVVDTPTGLREQTLTALDMADRLIVVSQVDVPGVANLRSYLDTVEQLGFDNERRVVVLNKELAESGITADDAQQVLGPVAGSLPFTAGVMRALNAGRPFCEVEPDHDTTKALRAVFGDLLPAEVAEIAAPEPEPTGLRAWWRRQMRQGK